MNRLILALIISCGLTACSNNGTKKSASLMWRKPSHKNRKTVWRCCIFIANSDALPAWQ